MKLAAIVNGSSSKARSTIKSLESITGMKVLVTKSAAQMVEFAKQVREEKFSTVVVCGGDGSLNTVVNEWLKSREEQLPKLGLIPGGSANDYARTIGYRNLKSLLKNIENDLTQEADVMEINANGHQRFALNVCNAGIGANIAKTVANRRNHLPSAFNYFTATVAWLMIYRTPKVKVMIDNYNISSYTTLLSVGKGKFAGDGLGVCPHAQLNDAKLAPTLIGKVGVLDFIRYLPQLRGALKINDPRIVYSHGKKIYLMVEKGKLSIDADGEYLGSLEKDQVATIKIRPAAIKIIRPF